MKKNIFICHRPYHILRSCDIISWHKLNDDQNILIVFDVKVAQKKEYQRFNTNKIFYSSFSNVIEMERVNEPSLHNLIAFIKCCLERMRRFKSIAKSYDDIDGLYFFCDNELEIQLLISMFLKENRHPIKRVLVDEGMVTYSKYTYNTSWLVKFYTKIVTTILGLRLFNYTWAYGASLYYNFSLANNPQRSNFRKPIEQLQPISDKICEEFRKKLSLTIKIPEKAPYFIYVSQPIKEIETRENDLLCKLIEITSQYNVPFFIKLHPMQDENKYLAKFGSEVMIEKSYPVELFYGEKVIVGGTGSSSLFNASLQGYKVLDISPLFRASGIGINSDFKWVNIPVVDSLESFGNFIKTYTL